MGSSRTRYLAPRLILAIDGFDELWIVEVDEIRPNSYHWPVFVMQLLHAMGVLAGLHEEETPKIGQSYANVS